MGLAGEDRAAFKPGAPSAWIQWKGTEVCMDIACLCGDGGHVDALFAYYVRCSACGRIYYCNPHIELVELTPDELFDEQGNPVDFRPVDDNPD